MLLSKRILNININIERQYTTEKNDLTKKEEENRRIQSKYLHKSWFYFNSSLHFCLCQRLFGDFFFFWCFVWEKWNTGVLGFSFSFVTRGFVKTLDLEGRFIWLLLPFLYASFGLFLLFLFCFTKQTFFFSRFSRWYCSHHLPTKTKFWTLKSYIFEVWSLIF